MFQPSLFTDFPGRVRRLTIAAVVLVVLGILGFRIAALIAPPPLTVEQPADQFSTSSRTIIVKGVTAPGAVVSINGRELVPDAQGVFAADLVLSPGANTIELTARTRHSLTARVIRIIQVITSEAPVAFHKIHTNIQMDTDTRIRENVHEYADAFECTNTQIRIFVYSRDIHVFV